MKICFLLAIVACATVFALPTQSDVQKLIAQAQKALSNSFLPQSVKTQIANLLNNPLVADVITNNWDALNASFLSRSEETAEPAERCLLLFAMLLAQMIQALQALATTAAPVP